MQEHIVGNFRGVLIFVIFVLNLEITKISTQKIYDCSYNACMHTRTKDSGCGEDRGRPKRTR